MRKVFLDDLPRWQKGEGSGNIGTINWSKCIGYKVPFLYCGETGEVEILEYIKEKGSIVVSYNKKNTTILCSSFRQGKIGVVLKKITNDFKIDIGENIIDTKRNIVIIDREYRVRNSKKTINEKWYKYKCNKCKNEDWIVESALIQGVGCNTCCDSPRKIVLGINTIWDTDRWMCSLGISEEDAKNNTKSTANKIEVVCPDCGKKRIVAISKIYTNKSIGCNCSDKQSYISKYIISVLDQLKVKYDTEAKYDWNKYDNSKNNKLTQASIDFVIYKDGREIPLEADGEFHRKDNSMSGMTKEQVKNIDKQRDENCLKYLGEETIRISDEGDVKENILNSKLAKEFDLSKIDWSKCEEFALKNIVKEVCNYWNNKEEWETTTTIAENNEWNIKGVSTIIKYLKKGTKLGWTSYDPKEEYLRVRKRMRVWNKKKTEILKDDKSLGIFESASELEKQSEELFGIKITHQVISSFCMGKYIGKTYKGFTFKYVENN